jgi:uncharacterized membrane protein
MFFTIAAVERCMPDFIARSTYGLAKVEAIVSVVAFLFCSNCRWVYHLLILKYDQQAELD